MSGRMAKARAARTGKTPDCVFRFGELSVLAPKFFKVVASQQPAWLAEGFMTSSAVEESEVFPKIARRKFFRWRKAGVIGGRPRKGVRFADAVVLYLIGQVWASKSGGLSLAKKRQRTRVTQMLRMIMKALLVHQDLTPAEWSEMEFLWIVRKSKHGADIPIALSRSVVVDDRVNLRLSLRPLFDLAKQLGKWETLHAPQAASRRGVRKARSLS